jgi:hypothetical protein
MQFNVTFSVWVSVTFIHLCKSFSVIANYRLHNFKFIKRFEIFLHRGDKGCLFKQWPWSCSVGRKHYDRVKLGGTTWTWPIRTLIPPIANILLTLYPTEHNTGAFCRSHSSIILFPYYSVTELSLYHKQSIKPLDITVHCLINTIPLQSTQVMQVALSVAFNRATILSM